MKSVKTVAHELHVRLAISHDLSVPIRTELGYEANDPYAVRALFHTLDQSGTVEWLLSRDMLAQALSEHTGHADVYMWPTSDPGHDVVHIALTSPAGSARLEFPAQGVESFLRETWSAVPPGTESSRFDLDAELAQLLGGS